MHAATIDAATWWARPRGAQSAAWIANYKNSLTSRHRDGISAIVGSLGVTSVLEVGCHCGPNLIRLATDHPSLEQLSGVDVSAEAISAGNAWAQSAGLSERVQMVPGRIPDASSMLADRCVDVVLSCYALAYIAPPDLDAVLSEMGRLARVAVILAEPMSDGSTDPKISFTGYSEWAHNYAAASRWINTWRGMTLTTRDVTPPVDRLSAILVATRGDTQNTL